MDERVKILAAILAERQRTAMLTVKAGQVAVGTIAEICDDYNRHSASPLQPEGMRAMLRRIHKAGTLPIRLDHARGVVTTALLEDYA